MGAPRAYRPPAALHACHAWRLPPSVSSCALTQAEKHQLGLFFLAEADAHALFQTVSNTGRRLLKQDDAADRASTHGTPTV